MSAIIYALSANGGSAVAKGAAAVYPGSSAMLTERESAKVQIDRVNAIQYALKVEFPAVRWVFFEPNDKG